MLIHLSDSIREILLSDHFFSFFHCGQLLKLQSTVRAEVSNTSSSSIRGSGMSTSDSAITDARDAVN